MIKQMRSSPLNRRILSLLIFAVLVPAVLASNLPLVPTNGVASITSRDLRTDLSFLASQELGGRYTFSSGNRIAARYLATELESFGYRGAARDGGYLQRIDFAARSLDQKATHLQILNSDANAQNKQSEF